MFYSPQGDYRHLKADCPNLTNEDPANVEEGPSQLPDCPLCLLMGQHQILPKALSAFREALGKPRREVEVSCYFFGFDHPTKLAFRLDQDWGADQSSCHPDFSTSRAPSEFARCPERAKLPTAAQVQPAEPTRYLPVPHTEQTARRAGRPFFIVTCSTSLEPVLARHFRQ